MKTSSRSIVVAGAISIVLALTTSAFAGSPRDGWVHPEPVAEVSLDGFAFNAEPQQVVSLDGFAFNAKPLYVASLDGFAFNAEPVQPPSFAMADALAGYSSVEFVATTEGTGSSVFGDIAIAAVAILIALLIGVGLAYTYQHKHAATGVR